MSKTKGKPKQVRRPRNGWHFTVWAVNGAPVPEAIIKKLDDAMQSVMDESKVRLAAATIKE